MHEEGPKHPLDFRKDLAGKLFTRINAGESCTVVGASSMGKTRLINFLMQTDARSYYLKEKAEKLFFLHVNCNKAINENDWGLYEIILSTIVNTSLTDPNISQRSSDFHHLRGTVVTQRDAFLGLRNLETSLNILIKREGLQVALLLDDFDKLYPKLTVDCLDQLRAIRDDHKNRFSYILFMRHSPAELRDKKDNEGFYELTSLYMYGLTPYTFSDAERMIKHLSERKQLSLSNDTLDKIWRYTGGHPGSITVLVRALEDHPEAFAQDDPTNMRKLIEMDFVTEECERLWEGLSGVEQEGFKLLAEKRPVDKTVIGYLTLKGLVREEGNEFLPSAIPLLYVYVKSL